jgi:hypothetical protein
MIAIGPYILVLGAYVPEVDTFWSEHSTAFGVLLVASVLAAGFIIDDIGSFVETIFWDKFLDTAAPGEHTKKWNEYLQLQLNDELIGQRYLRTKFTQLKFELAMGVALPIFWTGLLWVQFLRKIWSICGFMLASAFVLSGAGALLWASWETAKLLSRTRKIILDAFSNTNGPKGIKRGSGA